MHDTTLRQGSWISWMQTSAPDACQPTDFVESSLPSTFSTSPCLPLFFRKHSPDGATAANGRRSYKYCLLLIYLPQRDEMLSWACWLTYSRWVTHISDQPVVSYQLWVERGPRKYIGHRPTFYPLTHATMFHTRRSRASPVLTAIGLVNGNRHFRPPTESTSLNRSLNNLAQVITSTTATAAQNLVEILSWGASGQIG